MLNRFETRSLAQEHRRRGDKRSCLSRVSRIRAGVTSHAVTPLHLRISSRPAQCTAQCSLSLLIQRSSELNQRNPCARVRSAVQHVGWQPAKHSCQQIYNEEKPRKGLSRSLKNCFGTHSWSIRCDRCVNVVNKWVVKSYFMLQINPITSFNFYILVSAYHGVQQMTNPEQSGKTTESLQYSKIRG